MVPLLSCQSISKFYAGRPVFQNLSLTISEGERLGVIGPNGAGKSTLLQILAGRIPPDEGEVAYRKLLKLGYVAQDPQFPAGRTVQQILSDALAGTDFDEFEQLAQVNIALGRVGFVNGDAMVESLSGGWRKRLAIAEAIIRQPDLLLLDEPTNHLDLEGILWLEKLLQSAPFASVIVSHDRYFLDNVVSDMVEINRVYPDGLFRTQGDYATFLEKKDEFVNAQNKQQEALENKVRRELEWLRRGPKARTTKSKARIDEASRLMGELSEMQSRSTKGSTQIDFTATDRKTKRLLTAENVAKTLGGKQLFRHLNVVLTPGLRLGLVGPNGSGKSTLLHILRGALPPDGGEIRTADGLRIVYFDQNRAQLDPNVSLKRALAPDGDSVIFQDRVIHVMSWAKRFLFRPEQLELPVERLSGGEKARVLIAQLMLQPADVLLLDEPTNDLDIPTLEVLEDNLVEFTGALVLVTHDRYLLDRVSTLVVGLTGDGDSGMFADYRQWEDAQAARKQAAKAAPAKEAVSKPAAPASKRKLSYTEAREWEQMEGRIVEAEELLSTRQKEMEAAASSGDGAELQRAYQAMQAAQTEVDALYARWAELEAKLQTT